MEVYSQENVEKLVRRIVAGQPSMAKYLTHYFDKLKTELQVHTKGKLFEKVLTVFQNEDPEASKYVVNTYESVTKGSIWRGIDNLNRIFNNTGFNVQGDANAIKSLLDAEFFSEYINQFMLTTTATDPNTVQVWYRRFDGSWQNRFVETQFIHTLNDDEIAFVVPEESDYEILVENKSVASVIKWYERDKVDNSYFEGVKYVFGARKKMVYINKLQYVEMYADGDNSVSTYIYDFDREIKSPYSYTGVENIVKGVFHSAISGFIPFGNHALIQHRTFRSVEAMFGYPRMSEVEMPCDNCMQGQETCSPCEEYPDGLKPCSKCKGTGTLSLQSPFKIYKIKQYPEAPEQNINRKPIEFFTPDIGILDYNAEAWKKTLQMGEDAIYIQQRVETGNVESAKSREKQLESMYAWLGRISKVIYGHIQNALDNYCALHGFGSVTVEVPVSFAIMNELEAFDYLNQIVSVDAPIFIKTSHVENFLNKYVSKSSPIIKIVEVLKRIDPFIFYTSKDLQSLSDSGIINDRDWRVHSYAYPMLMNLYTIDNTVIEKKPEEIEKLLMVAIEKKTGKLFETAEEIEENSEIFPNDLKSTVGGLLGMIEIVKAVSSGVYDIDAAVALVADRFGISEESARRQLGSPKLLEAMNNPEEAAKLI